MAEGQATKEATPPRLKLPKNYKCSKELKTIFALCNLSGGEKRAMMVAHAASLVKQVTRVKS